MKIIEVKENKKQYLDLLLLADEQEDMIDRYLDNGKMFHFHKLSGNMDGFFAIDVKTRRDPWRIIIQPLDENEEPYDPCNIDEIAGVVRIVEVKEVSNHYE